MNEGEKHLPEAEATNLSDIDVSPLISEMNEYNKQFSMGRTMGRIMEGAARGEDIDANDHAHQKEVSLIAAKQKFDPILYRVGLDMESVEKERMFTSKATFAAAEVRINISDREKFLLYLQELDPKKITEGQARSLAAVFESLTKQLKKEYQVDNPEDNRMIELLAGLDKILGEVERIDPQGQLGIFEASKSLRTYHEALEEGHLKEYVLAERAGLLIEVGENRFGPSRWHIDSSPEYYQKRWEQALSVVQTVKKNPRAGEFFAKLKDLLERSAKYALDDLAKKLQENDNVKYHRPLMKILNEYYDKIAAS